jgi:hypothetical protein
VLPLRRLMAVNPSIMVAIGGASPCNHDILWFAGHF